MKKFIAVIMAMVLALSLVGCSSWSRGLKSMASDFGGGLYRRVTVYDYEGDVLGQWEGKFDVSETSTETFFDIDGKRVIIQGGIIINEEIAPTYD